MARREGSLARIILAQLGKESLLSTKARGLDPAVGRLVGPLISSR